MLNVDPLKAVSRHSENISWLFGVPVHKMNVVILKHTEIVNVSFENLKLQSSPEVRKREAVPSSKCTTNSRNDLSG